jgi:hypothetical protein
VVVLTCLANSRLERNRAGGERGASASETTIKAQKEQVLRRDKPCFF